MDVSGDDELVDRMVEEFPAETPEQIVEPITSGTADALTAAPKAKPVANDELEDDVALPTNAVTADNPDTDPNAPKRNGFMRFLGAIVPHIGDGAFDVVRKCIMLMGILVFIGAATYLVDDLILIPVQNTVLAESLQGLYTPDAPVTDETDDYPYPDGMDSAFNKLYRENNDVRGWISFHSTDGVTMNADYPIVQGADNDFYLFHDYYGTYNKNGTLFFDYRNKIFPTAKERNTIIYGHNMASGQMFAGLNTLLKGVEYARTAPSFTMNTLYEKGEYKVFAVVLANTQLEDGNPFGYLRTDFADNVEFATFLSEIQARSLYDYGDVDLRPDDTIVTLSTCSVYSDAHFNDGRTVVFARKVREGEDPATNVATITTNADVLMPYAWYINQDLEPHPYYLDANYVIQPIDTLLEYLATSTADPSGTGATTEFTLWTQNGTFGLISSITNPNLTIPANPPADVYVTQTTMSYLKEIRIDKVKKHYVVGEAFDYAGTQITGVYTDGRELPINPRYCALVGFNTNAPGTYYVTMHYGALNDSFTITVSLTGGDSTTTGTLSPNDTTTTVTPTDITFPPTQTTAVTTTTTKSTTSSTTTTKATTTTEATAAPTLPPVVITPEAEGLE